MNDVERFLEKGNYPFAVMRLECEILNGRRLPAGLIERLHDSCVRGSPLLLKASEQAGEPTVRGRSPVEADHARLPGHRRRRRRERRRRPNPRHADRLRRCGEIYNARSRRRSDVVIRDCPSNCTSRRFRLYDELVPEMPYIDWVERMRSHLAEMQDGVLKSPVVTSIKSMIGF